MLYSVHLNNTLIKIDSKRTNIPEYSKCGKLAYLVLKEIPWEKILVKKKKL